MGSRRRAREAALQALYQIDLNPGLSAAQALAHVFETFSAPEEDEAELRTFAGNLVRGVLQGQLEIDAALARASTHWRIERMAAVDRNLLRLAAFEILLERKTPPE